MRGDDGLNSDNSNGATGAVHLFTFNDDVTLSDEEVVDIEKETVMSKLRGSVNVPEEFKFADQLTFFTMLRNIFRGKNILVTGPSGCGKSSLGKILADITGKGYYSF